MASVSNPNAKVVAKNGLGPRTRILNMAKTSITQSDIDDVALALQAGGVAGTDDAVVIAGVAGAAGDNSVQIAVQGTGVLTAGANYRGVTGVTMSVLADFE